MVASMAKRFPLIPTWRLRHAVMLAAVGALAACDKSTADGKTDAGGKSTVAAPGGSTLLPGTGLSGDGGGVSITAPLPEPVLGGILGCWQLRDLETWTITRTPQNGAQLVRNVSARGSEGMAANYTARAAVPSDIQYDASQARLAFDTAGPKHGLLFVFQVTPTGLAGSWFAARGTGTGNFKYTGNDAVLERCGADGGSPPR
jgi:hypothetical protein